MNQSNVLICGSAFAVFLALGCAPAEEPMEEEPAEEPAVEEVEQPAEVTEQDAMVAGATLTTADGTAVGTVTFTETPEGTVQVLADFQGVAEDGAHGFHVHETGECSPPDFTSAGGHFNPEDVEHACPPTTPRHGGDFGNVEISGGAGSLTQTSDLITVTPGDTSVVDKAVILHAGEDDCTSQPSGDAGPRYACGVVAIASEVYTDETQAQPTEGGDAGNGGGY